MKAAMKIKKVCVPSGFNAVNWQIIIYFMFIRPPKSICKFR